jgi:hypothetical protein
MNRLITVALMTGVAITLCNESRAEGSLAKYRETAQARMDAAKRLVGAVTYETSETSYQPAGEIVEDLGNGLKKLRLKIAPHGLAEGYQDGPNTSASLPTNYKAVLSLTARGLSVDTDYGRGRTIRYEVDGTSASEITVSKSQSGVTREMRRPLMGGKFSEPAPIPAVLFGLATSDLDDATATEESGKLVISEPSGGGPHRERVVDPKTGQLLSVRMVDPQGLLVDETVCSGVTMVGDVALPTSMRVSSWTNDGYLKRVVELKDIKYSLK